MILIDTCIWIDYLNNKDTPQTRYYQKLRESQSDEICLSRIVYFELLRGIRYELQRVRIQKILKSFKIIDYLNDDFKELLELHQLCCTSGLNLPKLGDWLILKTVLDHSLELLTADRGFSRIHKIHPFKLIEL